MKRLPVCPDEPPSLAVGVLVLNLVVPESYSLKDKRSILLSLFSRLRRSFNISVAEIGDRDMRDRTILAVVAVNSDKAHCNTTLLAVKREVELQNELVLGDFSIEFW